MIISIHQPQYLPWIPYFSKIKDSDIFVFLDDVQFQKNGLQNRNFILSKIGELRLTIPVFHSLSVNINEIKISDKRILKKHWQTIEMNYKKSSFYSELVEGLNKIYTTEYELLCDLNIDLIQFYLDYLNIKTKIVKSSSLQKEGEKSDLVLSICKTLNASTYLTGTGGLDYLKQVEFTDNKIMISKSDYNLKEYKQINNNTDFIPHLSIMDLVFNEGKNSINYL